MAKVKTQQTHKYRNVIDDILDLGLILLMAIWYITGIDLDEHTVAMVGGLGASARVALRRILMAIWGQKLGIEAPE